MNFNQMKKIRQIRASSFGQVFGLLVLLSGFIGSTGFRVESGAWKEEKHIVHFYLFVQKQARY